MLKKESTVAALLFIALYFPFGLFFYQEGIAKGMSWNGFYDVFFESGKEIIFFKSILFASIASVISLVCGFLVAFTVIRSSLKIKRFFIFLFLLPIVVPPFVYIETVLYVSQLVSKNLFSPVSMIVVVGFIYMPISALIIGSGFLVIPKSIEESAVLMFPGNRWFYHITLSWVRPFIVCAYCITFLFVFSNYEIASLMNVQTYTLSVFNQFGAFYNYLDSIYLIIPIAILFLAIVTVLLLIIGRRSFYQITGFSMGRSVKLPFVANSVLMIVLIILSLLAIFPLIVVICKLSGITNPMDIIKPYWKEVLYSFALSSFAGIITVLCTAFFVRSMVLFSRSVRILFIIGALLPFAIPPSLIAFGLIKFSAICPGNSFVVASLILAIGLAARYFPVIAFILYTHALTINPHLIDAAEIQSGSWLRKFTRIWVPLNMSMMKKAVLFFVVISLGEIGLAVLLVPPDCMTASINIYSMLHYGFGKEVASETFLVVICTVIMGYFILRDSLKAKN